MVIRRRYRHYQRRRTGKKEIRYFSRPRIDPSLKEILKKIGKPESSHFIPDKFQLEAIEKLKESDVIVSAPTGAGKTWIASQITAQYLFEGKRTWYASPLKALSNSIYGQFCHEFGKNHCGILTGDRKENPDAPVIVGTTEILRNQLYDAMHQGVDIRADLVILDEAHYMGDPERGVVWEEVLIYLPSRVRLLLLSATIPNAHEICRWLEQNRGVRAQVVSSEDRPVPLEMLFLFPDGYLVPLSGRRGLNQKIKRFLEQRKRGPRKIDFGNIIECLREFNLLPTIFFLKSRMECNNALKTSHPISRPSSVKKNFEKDLNSFLSRFPHLREHPHLKYMRESAVASHHAGQLPLWKLLIENMMNRGYLDAIFSTSTVAAGVNFPARTVVLVQSDRYNGHEFKNLTSTELHQMIGRAGRRGKDNIGFALLVPGLHQDPKLIHDLKDSPPEPLMSQLHINFSMVLNLLLSHTPEDIKELLTRSFATFQEKQRRADLNRRWEEMLQELKEIIPEGKCDTEDPGEVIENISKMKELKRALSGLSRRIKEERRANILNKYLNSGRLFLHKNHRVYICYNTFYENGRWFSASINLKKALKSHRKDRLKLRKIPFDRIKGVYDFRIDLPEDYAHEPLFSILRNINRDELKLLNIEEPGDREDNSEISSIKERLEELPCHECSHYKDCHTRKTPRLKVLLSEFKNIAYQMEGMGEALWVNFKRHLRFLKDTGFVNQEDCLTPDGEWASKLRLDHPLLIAEAIRKKAFNGLSPEILAGCISPFVWDRAHVSEVKVKSPIPLDELEMAFDDMLSKIGSLRKLMVKRGFENPNILFWPAVAVYLWAKNIPWNELLSFVPIDEGDMASLIMRTADHLRQVTNLQETHPDVAYTAKVGIELILREPVYIE